MAFQYIKTDGKMGTSNASTVEEALKSPDIAPNSGVQRVQPPQPTVIAADEMTNPEKPYDVSTPKQSGSTDLNMAIGSIGTYKPPEMPKNQDREDSLSRIKELIGEASKKPGETIDIQEEEGVFKKQEALTDIENRILTTTREQQKAERLIRKNLKGTFGGAMEQELYNLKLRSDEQNADLAIVKAVALNDLNTALNISEAKINAKYEPLRIELEGLKTFLELNQNDLSESEQLQLQEQINQRQTIFDAQVTKEKDFQGAKNQLLASAAQQGAPSSIMLAIQNAKTTEEAIKAAGTYGGDMVARSIQLEQLKKLRQENSGATDELLSVDEAFKLGVPYGTTKKQAAGMSNNTTAGDTAKVDNLTEKVALIDQILTSPGLSSRVGTVPLVRRATSPIAALSGAGQEFAGKLKQLTSQETLDTLTALKAAGGTLGATNAKEFGTLENAATAINNWEVKNPETGEGLGEWEIDEETFKAEVKRLKTAAQKIISSYLGYDPTLFSADEMADFESIYAPSSNAPVESFY